MPSDAAILMTAEGTYPFYGGGVSVWCDQLISTLAEYRYHVFAVTHSPSQPQRFAMPENVAGLVALPLWGTEEPGWQAGDFATRYQRRVSTTPEVLALRFARPFQAAAGELLAGEGSDPEALAAAFHELYRFFQEFDYSTAMGSEPAWRIFQQRIRRRVSFDEQPNLEEATQWMRWLTRYLAILSVPVPRVDLVHSSFAGLAATAGVLAKFEYGSAHLLSEHGIFLRELYLALSRSNDTVGNRRFLRNLNRALVKMNYHFADLITTLGEFNRAWQRRFGAPDEKIVPLPNGVDSHKFRPETGRLPERPTVLTMARISPIKGIDTLVRAAARVRERIPDVRFRVCGDVADERYLAEVKAMVAQHSLEDTVEFGIARDVPRAYREAHVFCLASNSEGMPYSILEAMLSGCPVVATDVGNVAETVGDCGLLVRPNQPGQLGEALVSLLEGETGERRRARLAARALERARARYTIEQMTGRCRELYGQLLGRVRERPCITNLQYA